MTEIRSIDFPAKDQPLRDDVSALGSLLGEVLLEQHGESLLKCVESVRTAAILRREQQQDSSEQLDQILSSMNATETELLIRAFSTYLRLVNLAEKVHRIRRRRSYQHQGDTAQRGSFEYVLDSLFADKVDPAVLIEAVKGLRIRPVFTAHPTEATRRSILEKEYSIVHRLVERLNPDQTPQENERCLLRIRDAITSAWQTRAMPQASPLVADELDNILFYLTTILYRVLPAYHESLETALNKRFELPKHSMGVEELLRFGSWVGGDMDGNPNVTSHTIRATTSTHRDAVIRCYLPELKQLARYLSQTRGEAGILPELEQRLSEYQQQMPGVQAATPARHVNMPYRCLLNLMITRLKATISDSDYCYHSAAEFIADIRLIRKSLAENKGHHAGMFGVRRLLLRAQSFGFHLATLDIRQDALRHRQVLAELLGKDDWLQLKASDRTDFLLDLLSRDRIPAPREMENLSEETRETLDVFRVIGQIRQKYGVQATGLFIISMTQGADDVLTTLALARMAGLGTATEIPLDVTPLLETVADLDAGADMMTQLLQSDFYLQHLKTRDHRQFVMVGYSDSNKESGIVAARWGLQTAQRELAEIGRKQNVRLHFFHGRGGTVSRGGGNLVKGIEGAPTGTIGGYMRVTEQGEVINQKYGIRPIALRNLELITGATLAHGLADIGQHASEQMREMMSSMAATARARYHELVHQNTDFVPFFRKATPIDVIERLNIGSRPSARRGGSSVDDLRAIPWVFSWAQTRVGFPGVFGFGTALQTLIEQAGLDQVRDMHRRWGFFQGLVNDVEMVLAKSDLEIGARYAALADSGQQYVFQLILKEFELATQAILDLTQSRNLLDNHRTLQRNIRLRNPYVDPIHLLQINLLSRWRAGDCEDAQLLDALKSTVNGIALGIQNTG
jgi:phosphoenolpyruvate carboxylase